MLGEAYHRGIIFSSQAGLVTIAAPLFETSQ
jgi:hypothetical protein